MSEELKPCPFCGGRAKVYKGHSLYADKIPTCIFCTKCGAQTLLCRLEQAPKLWNTRTETPMQKRIEELEAERDRLKKNHAELGKKLGAMISFCGNLPEHLVTGEALEIVNEVYGG